MELLAGTTLAVDIEPGSAGLSDRGEGWVRPGRRRVRSGPASWWWWGEVPVVGGAGVVGGGGEVPVAFVDEAVMTGAEQDQVVEVGASAVLPFVDVVGVAAGGVGVAAGERAVPVAAFQCAA